jgi:hypothetical protein
MKKANVIRRSVVPSESASDRRGFLSKVLGVLTVGVVGTSAVSVSSVAFNSKNRNGESDAGKLRNGRLASASTHYGYRVRYLTPEEAKKQFRERQASGKPAKNEGNGNYPKLG